MCRTTLIAVFCLGCIPVSEYEIPKDVDWIAAISIEIDGMVPGYLYPVDEALPVVRSQYLSGRGWLVGYSGKQLGGALSEVGLPKDLYLVPAKRRAQVLEPIWLAEFGSPQQVPLLSLGAPANAPDMLTRTIELSDLDIDFGALAVFGRSDDSELLVVTPSGRVFLVGDDEPSYLGRSTAQIDSIVRHSGVFWASDSGSIRSGSGIDSMETVSEGDGWVGRLHIDSQGQLLFVTWDGRLLRLPKDLSVVLESPTEAAQLPQVENTSDGSVVAAGNGWAWRYHENDFEADLDIASPFAEWGRGLVFRQGNVIGFVSPTEPGATASFLLQRPMEQVLTIMPYGNGLVAVSRTRMFWIDGGGDVTTMYFFEHEILGVQVVDAVIYTLDINTDRTSIVLRTFRPSIYP